MVDVNPVVGNYIVLTLAIENKDCFKSVIISISKYLATNSEQLIKVMPKVQ